MLMQGAAWEHCLYECRYIFFHIMDCDGFPLIIPQVSGHMSPYLECPRTVGSEAEWMADMVVCSSLVISSGVTAARELVRRVFAPAFPEPGAHAKILTCTGVEITTATFIANIKGAGNKMLTIIKASGWTTD